MKPTDLRTASPPKTVNRNIEIQDLDAEVDRLLSILASINGVTKKEIIRRALTAYAQEHRGDITTFIEKGKRHGKASVDRES